MTNDSEKELVKCIKRGEPTCLKSLVEKYWSDLIFLAQNIVNDSSLANDVVQESLIKAIRQIEQFEERSSLRTWLHRIVTNESLMLLRKQSSRKEESLDSLMIEFDESGHYIEHYTAQPASLDKLLESADVRNQLQLAVDKLPEIHRVTFVLRDVEGYTCKEAAAFLDTSEENIKVRLHRARLAIRNILGPVLNDD